MEKDKLVEEQSKLEEQFNSGSSWFYWIAGLSLVNMIMLLVNGRWSFIFGLGITELVDFATYIFSLELGSVIYYAGIGINLFILSVFMILGRLSKKGYNWSFIVGIVLYALDGLLLVWLEDYMSALFHVYPLYFIIKGFQANQKLARIKTYTCELEDEGLENKDELTEVQLNFRNEMREMKNRERHNQ